MSLYWAADGVWLLTSAEQTLDDGIGGDIARVSLETGAQSSVAKGQADDPSYGAAAGGVTLATSISQDVFTGYIVYGPGGVVWTNCGLLGRSGDLRPLISPDGTRVVCWGWRADGKTDVGVLDVGAPDAISPLDVFRLDPGQYQSLGWLSEGAFLLARLDRDSKQEAYFSYDLSARKIADFPLPFALEPGEQLDAFDYATQVYISSGSPRGTITIHRADGASVATVPRVGQWALSGQRLLASDWDGGLTMVDLETGDVVGTWTGGAGLELRAYGYPAHAG